MFPISKEDQLQSEREPHAFVFSLEGPACPRVMSVPTAERNRLEMLKAYTWSRLRSPRAGHSEESHQGFPLFGSTCVA